MCRAGRGSMTIPTIAAAQAPAPPAAAPAPPPPQTPPSLVPSKVVDLMTPEGSAVFDAQWKSMEAKIVEGPAIANAMPGFKTSYDIQPHAGERGFDDSSLACDRRQGAGRPARRRQGVLHLVPRELTIPAKVGDFDTSGATAVLTAYVDDYAEGLGQWADAAPRRLHQPSHDPRLQHAQSRRARRLLSSQATSFRSQSSASTGRFSVAADEFRLVPRGEGRNSFTRAISDSLQSKAEPRRPAALPRTEPEKRPIKTIAPVHIRHNR